MLVVATLAWGASFPLMKAIALAQDALLPGRASWFHSGLVLAWRFAIAAALLVIVRPSMVRRLRPAEWRQGAGLGLFAGLGVLLQADGLNYTSASVSAFLTQFTCLLVPLVQAVQRRRPPAPIVAVSSALVLAGCGILSGFDWRTLRMGRGEFETLVSAAFFTGQILFLGKRSFAGNNMQHVTLVMFITIAVLLFPAAATHAQSAGDLLVPFASAGTVTMLAALTLVCSLIAFTLMNRWQPHVDPAHASIIYCTEPLFAACFALVLPAWLSAIAGIAYQNETFTLPLVLGGGLITLANLLLVRTPVEVERDR
jgi:drug/metabolite transporter (DMT)-like permease